MEAGVYCITNKTTNRCYIGGSVKPFKRWNEHQKRGNEGWHHSRAFQEDWDKHGADDFEFRVLLWCSRDNLRMYEQACMNRFLSYYNATPSADSQFGLVMDEDARKKMAAAARRNRNRLGKPHTAESKAKISANRKGKGGGPRDPERLRKISEALKGRTLSEEVRKKISDSLRGHKQSAETIAKRVKKLRGRKMPPGFAEAAAERMRGKKLSAEMLKKVRESRKCLSEDQVREIRALAESGVRHKEIAARYGISANNVSVIKIRKSYAWVT